MKNKPIFLRSSLTSIEKLEGETIETKVKRMIENKEPIKDGAPEIFTERKDGVLQAYNIRADRFEIATEAMDKVTASKQAKRESKVINLNKEEPGEKESPGETKEG